MNMGSVLDNVLASAEARSWDVKTETWYSVYVKKVLHRSSAGPKWLSGRWREQSEDFPTGITRERAKEIAGKTGQVVKVSVTRERIQ